MAGCSRGRCSRRYSRLLAAALFLLAAPDAMNEASAQLSGQDIRIGVGGPLTTGSATFGVEMRQAVDLAVAERNAAGGVLGAKVVAVAADDAENGGVVAELPGDRFAPLIAGLFIGRDGHDLGAQHAAGRVLLGHREIHGLPHLDPERRRAGGQRAADTDPDLRSGELRAGSIHGIRRQEQQQHETEPRGGEAPARSAGASRHSNLPNDQRRLQPSTFSNL